MSLIVLTSAAGAPGVTTTALGMTLTWPRDVLLCDADRDPAQAILAGFLHNVDAGGRSIANLARRQREASLTVDTLLAEALLLTPGRQPDRRFIPGFPHPGSAALFQSVWPGFVETLTQVSRLGIDVIVDAGRIGREGLPPALLAEARVILVVVRSQLRSLAAARLYLPYLRDQLDQVAGSGQVALVVVGPGHPYTVSEIEAQFKVPVWGSVVQHERASVLSEGDLPPKRFDDGPLMRSMTTLSSHTCANLDATLAAIEAGAR